MHRHQALLAALISCGILSGCGANCRETERMADFEFSQGNHARAAKLYDEAAAADPAGCPDAGAKAENARLLLQR